MMERAQPTRTSRPPPRSLQFVSDQLAQVADLLQRAEQYGEQDAASRAILHSLRRESADLTEELAAAKLLHSGDDGVFALEGEAVVGHSVPLGILGDFMSSLQGLSTSVGKYMARVLGNNIATRREARDLGTLYAVAHTPSSFAIHVRHRAEIEPLHATEAGNVTDFIKILLLPDDWGREFAETICQAEPSIYRAYRRLLETMGRSSVDVKVATRSRPYVDVLTSRQAAERAAWLRTVTSEMTERVVFGELVGASLPRMQFEIDSADRTYKGSATATACEQVRDGHLLGKYVVATLREYVEENEHHIGEPSYRYELLIIAESESREPEASE